MKSSSSVGPRSPAFSEFWLSPIATPWFVVIASPHASDRARSSAPDLADALSSLSVLAEAARESQAVSAPRGGATAFPRPNSLALPALQGIAAARDCAAARCSAGEWGPGDGVRRAEVAASRLLFMI